MRKSVLFLLFIMISCVCSVSKASSESSFNNLLYGTWFVYGFGLYQPNPRTINSIDNTSQVVYPAKFYYGIGLGKDNVRLEYTKYLNTPRFVAAFDFFPNDFATPYVGYVYSAGDIPQSQSSASRILVKGNDFLIGATLQPLSIINFYAEYLLKDNFFFVGIRVKLGYKYE